jgi:hypothetical protein
MFLTMNACMMIKFCSWDWCLCRIYQPFCAVPHTSVTDFSWLQSPRNSRGSFLIFISMIWFNKMSHWVN